MVDLQAIHDLLNSLSPDEQRAVERYLESLQRQRSQASSTEPDFAWAGALSDLRDRFTSVDLQHALLSARIDQQ